MGNKTTGKRPAVKASARARVVPPAAVTKRPARKAKAAAVAPALAVANGVGPSNDPRVPDFAWLPIERVKPWVQNPRKNARAVGKVADSIRALGWGRPLVVNMWPSCQGELIIGHTAWLAAHELGLTVVPVRMRMMEPAAAHALAIADNKLGEIADWDPDELGRIVGSGEITGAHLAIAGFSEAELEALKNPPAITDTTIEATTECTCPQCGHKWQLQSRSKKASEAA